MWGGRACAGPGLGRLGSGRPGGQPGGGDSGERGDVSPGCCGPRLEPGASLPPPSSQSSACPAPPESPSSRPAQVLQIIRNLWALMAGVAGLGGNMPWSLLPHCKAFLYTDVVGAFSLCSAAVGAFSLCSAVVGPDFLFQRPCRRDPSCCRPCACCDRLVINAPCDPHHFAIDLSVIVTAAATIAPVLVRVPPLPSTCSVVPASSWSSLLKQSHSSCDGLAVGAVTPLLSQQLWTLKLSLLSSQGSFPAFTVSLFYLPGCIAAVPSHMPCCAVAGRLLPSPPSPTSVIFSPKLRGNLSGLCGL